MYLCAFESILTILKISLCQHHVILMNLLTTIFKNVPICVGTPENQQEGGKGGYMGK